MKKPKEVNGKNITAAVVMIDRDGSILACHATGKGKDKGYDFPKGLVEVDESDLFAAMRELQEETGIWLYDPNGWWTKANRLIDCGIYRHNNTKDIHIFLYRVDEFPDLNQLECTSYFERDGKSYPEVDSFKIIKKDERYMFNKVLHDKFAIIDQRN